jgi:hypothetical protein
MTKDQAKRQCVDCLHEKVLQNRSELCSSRQVKRKKNSLGQRWVSKVPTMEKYVGNQHRQSMRCGVRDRRKIQKAMHAIVILTPVGQNMSKKKLIPKSRRHGKKVGSI